MRQKYRSLAPIMDERVRRRWAASEALALGWGGITAVAEATGLSLNTIRMGIAENRSSEADPNDQANGPHVRRPGGGRKRLARAGSDPPHRPGDLGQSLDPRRPPVPVTMDLQEHTKSGGGPGRSRPSGQPSDGGPVAPGDGLQPASQPQDPGRGLPPRPGCPVRVHRQASPFVPEARSARRVGGHEEEGIGRGFQERRARMATRGVAGRGPLHDGGCTCTTSRPVSRRSTGSTPRSRGCGW